MTKEQAAEINGRLDRIDAVILKLADAIRALALKLQAPSEGRPVQALARGVEQSAEHVAAVDAFMDDAFESGRAARAKQRAAEQG